MTKGEAIAIARRHVARRNAETLFHAELQQTIDEPEEYRNCWYFDYIPVYNLGRLPGPWDILIGSLPGFVVNKQSRSVQVISLHALFRLQRFDRAVAELAQQPPTLRLLRQHFTIPLLELQAFKRELEAPALSQQQKIHRLEQQLLAEPDFEAWLDFNKPTEEI